MQQTKTINKKIDQLENILNIQKSDKLGLFQSDPVWNSMIALKYAEINDLISQYNGVDYNILKLNKIRSAIKYISEIKCTNKKNI